MAHNICQDCNPPCVLTRLVPCQDLAMWDWASHPGKSAQRPSRGTALMLRDRYLRLNALDEHGLPVTGFALPTEFASPGEAAQALDGPFVARPRAERRVQELPDLHFDDDDALAASRWRGLDHRWLLQADRPAAGLQSVVQRGPGVDGGLLRFHGGVPQDGLHGSAARRIPGPCPPEVASLVEAVVDALGVTGAAVVVLSSGAGRGTEVVDVHAHLGFHCVDSERFPAAMEGARPPGVEELRDAGSPGWLRTPFPEDPGFAPPDPWSRTEEGHPSGRASTTATTASATAPANAPASALRLFGRTFARRG
ncbi:MULTISPECIES: hypothetical protein [Arthrobacter]|uniref:Uncharacterized protein n=2 Tax=Arthrobacter TaxID=1663 RepID=A0ABU9KHQ3_9MICC|nr:hypothetical protein [Arthrobacter sp. YJM1]MDP5226578.1 hypothetical protein [Arthrobacter sp. YJM1]